MIVIADSRKNHNHLDFLSLKEIHLSYTELFKNKAEKGA